MDKKQQFIEEIAKFAVADYNRSKILPSLTIAQAILESGWGRSGLAKQSKNLFGIKAFDSWKGKKKLYRTREVYNGKETYIDAWFREYENYEGSIKDHNDLLQNKRYEPVRNAKNYVEAATQIQKCGYATDPEYTKLLIKIIESNNLQKYDVGVEYQLKKEDADKIIKILQKEFAQATQEKNEDKKKEIAYLADEIRKSSGQKPQNS